MLGVSLLQENIGVNMNEKLNKAVWGGVESMEYGKFTWKIKKQRFVVVRFWIVATQWQMARFNSQSEGAGTQ